MNATLSHLIEHGWARVPAVVPPHALPALAEACRRHTGDDPSVAADSSQIVADGDIGAALFSSPVLETVISILGPGPLLLPSVTVRKNVYVDWHVDGAFRNGLGGCQERPLFLQCAIYLAPNGADGGGGLSVVPNSHRRVEIGGRQYAPAETLSLIHSRRAIVSEPGDLVMWDGRTLHASSTPPAGMNERFGLFVSFAAADAPADGFLDHLERRANEVRPDGNTRENARYRDAVELDFPGTFHPETVRTFRRHGVGVATRAACTNAGHADAVMTQAGSLDRPLQHTGAVS